MSSSTPSSKQPPQPQHYSPTPPPLRNHRTHPHHIVLGITGSVAAVKGPELAIRLTKEVHAHVRIVLTRGGNNFWNTTGAAKDYHEEYWQQLQQQQLVQQQQQEEEQVQQAETQQLVQKDQEQQQQPLEIKEQQRRVEPTIQIHYADDEWQDWKHMGDSILHIELRNWADLMVIAPLSAHTLAKLAHGLCDDTLSCVMRAWDFSQTSGKPVVLAPAMNTAMWEHPLTQIQLDTICNFCSAKQQKQPINNNNNKTSIIATTPALQPHHVRRPTSCKDDVDDDANVVEDDGNTSCCTGGGGGIYIVPPQVKQLACGDIGIGAMASVDDIIKTVQMVLLASETTTRLLNNITKEQKI